MYKFPNLLILLFYHASAHMHKRTQAHAHALCQNNFKTYISLNLYNWLAQSSYQDSIHDINNILTYIALCQ